ncbi:hypothetical protein Barb4_03808 [Bacteroidales bacterium Barb4]|nr:hypothetical protein Barb4_03808 [Bacteroidales bacterium Barb4]
MPEVGKVGSIFIKGIDFARGRYVAEGSGGDCTVIGLGPQEVNGREFLATKEGTVGNGGQRGGYG